MLVRDYFDGYRAEAPHPKMTSTGSEGFCDICGRRETRDHDEPWKRVAPQYYEKPDPPAPLLPIAPFIGPKRKPLDF